MYTDGEEEEDEEDGDGEIEEEEEEDDGFMRQNDAGLSSKWHPNTIKMCMVLRKKMPHMDSGHVSFGSLTKGSRRSKAANKFFEVLQLKTWDYIQVKQVSHHHHRHHHHHHHHHH